MGIYNFDKIIDRKGTNCVKVDALKHVYGRDDLQSLWVADMDFEAPDFIVDALKERMEHPVFGYTFEPAEYWPTIINWIKDRHGWEVKKEWMKYIPGIVKGIGMAVNVFLKEDEKVIIQPPVYHPFRLVPLGNRREVVYNPLVENEDGTYSMDFDNLEKVADDKCKMLILSNPHNPAGIVWDKETLRRLAHFCSSRGIIVISDEIHCDMALFGHKHIPFATVSDEAAECSITFGAPTKTFNFAGIVSSYVIISSEKLRKPFFEWLEANEQASPNLFAPIATIAAFSKGEQYREELVSYIEGNIMFIEDFCRENMPKIKPLRPQASYLVWIDCRGLGLDHDSLIDFFLDKAHLALNDGEMFGKEGKGFMRLNVGEPRSEIEKAMASLKAAYDTLDL